MEKKNIPDKFVLNKYHSRQNHCSVDFTATTGSERLGKGISLVIYGSVSSTVTILFFTKFHKPIDDYWMLVPAATRTSMEMVFQGKKKKK